MIRARKRNGYPEVELGLASSVKRPRRLRFFASFAPAPGSHGMGRRLAVWTTRWDDLRGVNLRAFHSFRRPCLTVLLHWQDRGVGNWGA